VRIYIDGRYVCDGRATVSEVPSRHRKVNVPIGRQIGYTIDVEFAGNALPRAIEYTFEGMSHES
jgi:hypothetical protein